MKKEIFTAAFISFLILGNLQAKTLGDFNNDGELNIADAIGFILVLMGKNPANDVGQEYLLASECQGVQSDLVGDWEEPATEDGVRYFTHVITFHNNGTFWDFWLADEIIDNRVQVYEHGWDMGTYSTAGDMLTLNFIVEPRGYTAGGNSATGTYTISGDTLTIHDPTENADWILTRRNP